jgi:hypothetical protein
VGVAVGGKLNVSVAGEVLDVLWVRAPSEHDGEAAVPLLTPPQRQELRLELRGFGSAPESVEVNGEGADSSYDEDTGTLMVPLSETGDALTVEIVR